MKFEDACKHIFQKLENELPRHLSYHSVEHINDVRDAAERIGKAENITDHERLLLLTAACYHDAGFIKGAKEHEMESCRIASEALPQFGYSETDIATINGMIMATKIPQSPNNHLEQILADADLDYLGRDDFFTIGEKLFNELSMFGFINSENEWNKLQERFLTAHHYFTETAIATRQQQKEEHLQTIKAKIH